ncbi:hypothetical protein Tco_0655055 [Tanacetum coccineum]|uniref:Uncharacterized protein n=1 Tax=Tanacetum coccineum TaxID=301880 RepID=A0ABQ4X621_9ASTR
MLHKSGRIDEDVSNQIKAAWMKWRAATGVLCDRNVPLKLKGKFYRVAIRPAMLYGSECWPITKALTNRVEVAELRMLRHVRRRPQSSPVRRVEALVVDGLRRRGRPKLRWEDKVKHDMKELLLSEDMTSDRNEWRARIRLDRWARIRLEGFMEGVEGLVSFGLPFVCLVLYGLCVLVSCLCFLLCLLPCSYACFVPFVLLLLPFVFLASLIFCVFPCLCASVFWIIAALCQWGRGARWAALVGFSFGGVAGRGVGAGAGGRGRQKGLEAGAGERWRGGGGDTGGRSRCGEGEGRLMRARGKETGGREGREKRREAARASERRERASRSGARENESEKTIEHNDKKEQKTEQRESNERKRSRRRARQLETKERGKRETGASQRENESRHDKRDKPRRNAGATSAGRERDGSRERAERKHEQRR